MVKEKINFGKEFLHKKLLRSDVMDVHMFAAELKISKIPVIVRRCFQGSLPIANNKKNICYNADQARYGNEIRNNITM